MIGVYEQISRWFPFTGSSSAVVRATSQTAPMNTEEPLPTRRSLLDRLKDAGDHASWEDFHRTYRGLLFGVARRAGLNEHEAGEAVQDTLIAVAKKLPDFRYDPGKDSFKGWLLQLTRWKVADQLRRRASAGEPLPDEDDEASRRQPCPARCTASMLCGMRNGSGTFSSKRSPA